MLDGLGRDLGLDGQATAQQRCGLLPAAVQVATSTTNRATSGNVLTQTVNNLPTNGSTVYVTLYSLVGGQWLNNQYTYTAFNASSCLSTITSPAAGDRPLTAYSDTFGWTASTNPGCSGAVLPLLRWLQVRLVRTVSCRSGNVGLVTVNWTHSRACHRAGGGALAAAQQSGADDSVELDRRNLGTGPRGSATAAMKLAMRALATSGDAKDSHRRTNGYKSRGSARIETANSGD